MVSSIGFALSVAICTHLVSVILVNAKTNDELYNSIFRFGKEKMTELEVRMGLIQLNSYSSGLAWNDPRRAAVSYWLDAAINQDSKCSGKADELLRNQLHDAELNAGVQRAKNLSNDEIFNLETYANGIRVERLLYCESTIGRQFNQELKMWLTDKRKALSNLVKFNGYGQIRMEVIARRVAELIADNLDTATSLALSCKLDHYELISRHYEQFSPCIGLLRIVDHYKDYYNLLIAPGNYQHLSPLMKVRVDEVSVCSYIQETPQLYIFVADNLQHIFKEKYDMCWPCFDINQPQPPPEWRGI